MNIKGFCDKIKNTANAYAEWVIIIEAFSLVAALAFSFIVVSVSEGIEGINFMGILYRITNKGEAFLLGVPLLSSLIVELYVRKERKRRVFTMYIILLIIYSAWCPALMLKEDKLIVSVFITAFFPIFSLNFAAGYVIRLPDAADYNNRGKQ